MTAPLRCPLPSPTDPAEPCPVEAPAVGLLAAHLATDHLVSAGDAFRRAQEAAGRGNGPAAREIPAERQDAAQAPAVSAPRTKEDHPVSLSDPFPCKKCRRPFMREHSREQYCKACRGTTCTACGKSGGTHQPSCLSAAAKGKKPAPKPAPKPAAPKRPAPSPVPALPGAAGVRVLSNTTREAAEALLKCLREDRARLDAVIAGVEGVVEIL